MGQLGVAGDDVLRRVSVAAARTLARASVVADHLSYPVRRDFTTALSVQDAFIHQGIDKIAKIKNDLQFTERWIDKIGLTDTTVSRSSHQAYAKSVPLLVATSFVALVTAPAWKTVSLLSQLGVALGLNTDGGGIQRQKEHNAALKANGNKQVHAAGRNPQPSPQIQSRLQARNYDVARQASETRVRADAPGQLGSKIKKVVVINMENHTVDNMFSQLLGNDDELFTANDKPNFTFSWWPVHGKFSTRRQQWMSVHERFDEAQIPMHFENARRFAFIKDHFSARNTCSSPNHQSLGLGWSHNQLNNFYTGLVAVPVDIFMGQPEHPPYDMDCIQAHLEAAGRSWGNYGDGSLTNAIPMRNSPNHLPIDQFFADVSADKMRDVSWIVPPSEANEHAPNSIWPGQAWMQSVFSTIEDAGHWDEVAIYVTYDDYGGWFDHVTPELKEAWIHDPRYQAAWGSRIPVTLISPYAKPGYYLNDPGSPPGKTASFFSANALIAKVFGMGSIQWNDQRPAYTYTGIDDLERAFDINQQPLSPPRWTPTPQPKDSVLRRFVAAWKQAGKVADFADLKSLYGFKLGFHEAVTRRVFSERRQALGLHAGPSQGDLVPTVA